MTLKEQQEAYKKALFEYKQKWKEKQAVLLAKLTTAYRDYYEETGEMPPNIVGDVARNVDYDFEIYAMFETDLKRMMVSDKL